MCGIPMMSREVEWREDESPTRASVPKDKPPVAATRSESVGQPTFDDLPTSKLPIEGILAHLGDVPLEPSAAQNAAMVSEELRRAVLLQFEDFAWRSTDKSCVCTACGGGFVDRIHAHKSCIPCPRCGKTVELRDKRYKHSKLFESFAAVDWRKSIVEKNAVLMIGCYCCFDSRGDNPEAAQKLIVPVQLVLFRYGKGAVRYQRSALDWENNVAYYEWERRRDVHALGVSYVGHKFDTVISNDNFMETIRDTPFAGAFATLTAARAKRNMAYDNDHCEDIAAIARRPWIEYMIKAGFGCIGRNAAMYATGKTLNLRGKCLRDILRLSKDRYAEVRGRHMDLKMEELELLQTLDRAGLRISAERAIALQRAVGSYQLKHVLSEYGAPDARLIKYLRRNARNAAEYVDYLRAAQRIGLDLRAEDARFPPDLREAHERMIAQEQRAKLEADREKARARDAQIKARLKKLERDYCFSAGGLTLRPARSAVELIDEGNALKHCVGRYVESYALGKTVICFLRRADAPDVPWRTVEFVPGSCTRVQNRGYRNDMYKPLDDDTAAEIKAFWDEFDRCWEGKHKCKIAS